MSEAGLSILTIRTFGWVVKPSQPERLYVNTIGKFLNNMSDQVNHPSHYLKNGMECIDVMIEKFGTEAVINFCECNEFKYLWRAGLKEGNSAETDRAKAAWYRKKAEELKIVNH